MIKEGFRVRLCPICKRVFEVMRSGVVEYYVDFPKDGLEEKICPGCS